MKTGEEAHALRPSDSQGLAGRILVGHHRPKSLFSTFGGAYRPTSRELYALRWASARSIFSRLQERTEAVHLNLCRGEPWAFQGLLPLHASLLPSGLGVLAYLGYKDEQTLPVSVIDCIKEGPEPSQDS
jgi:hypothetical protein